MIFSLAHAWAGEGRGEGRAESHTLTLPLPPKRGRGDVFHLNHGPIDCLCLADAEAAEVRAANAQARAAFATILPDLCAELPLLRTPLPSPTPAGAVARAMHAACAPFSDRVITPMAAVAGAVADHVLAAMTAGRSLRRASVNNRGDIAVHLAPGEHLRIGMVTELAAPALDGVLTLDASCGVATSGRACKGQGGRSFSFGIADAVTVRAPTAAMADAAATVIANAVDLPGHPAITRRPARDIDPDSDLGGRAITWDVGPLTPAEIARALDAGRAVAETLRRDGLIGSAALVLRRRVALVGARETEREVA